MPSCKNLERFSEPALSHSSQDKEAESSNGSAYELMTP